MAPLPKPYSRYLAKRPTNHDKSVASETAMIAAIDAAGATVSATASTVINAQSAIERSSLMFVSSELKLGGDERTRDD